MAIWDPTTNLIPTNISGYTVLHVKHQYLVLPIMIMFGDCLPVEVHAWHVPLHPAWMEIATACCTSGRIQTALTDHGFPLQYREHNV